MSATYASQAFLRSSRYDYRNDQFDFDMQKLYLKSKRISRKKMQCSLVVLLFPFKVFTRQTFELGMFISTGETRAS